MSLPSLPQDKANHVIYGSAIALVVYAVGLSAGVQRLPALALALGVVVLIGALKELNDARINYSATGNWRTGPHGVEGLDALATWAGGAMVFLAGWL